MKYRQHLSGILWIIFLLCCFPHTIHAYSLRQFSNKNGLSNSAILSLYQDRQGMMWIGSCDGLNVFDGTNIRMYAPMDSSKTSLSGNLINRIMEGEEQVLWIQTNYGLDRLDTKRQTSRNFPEFRDKSYMAQSSNNDLFIIKDDGYIYHYQQQTQTFQKQNLPPVAFEHILSTTVDQNNILWIFASGNHTCSYQIEKTEQGITLVPTPLFTHSEKLLWAFTEGEQAYFIDEFYSLYEYDFNNQRQYYVADLKAEIENRGEVSSIIRQRNDYYIGFKSSGLVVLKHIPDQKIKYQIQPTDIHSGIFCLVKDKFQDIVWVGTDGQGVYMYYEDVYSVTNTLLDTPLYQINNPVRALYYDEDRTLWIGTKGGGILRIKNYSPSNTSPASFDRISAANSTLTDNAVYCFAPGSRNNLWIGTENGINFYSYKSRQLKEFPLQTDDGKKVKYVHSIHELNDTTLWICTVGEGIVKAILNKGKENFPLVKSATRIVLDGGRMASNFFFTSFQENDSILWFGNRGYGAYRLNIETGKLTPYRFDDVVSSQTANDIFSIYKNEKGYWLGTSSGLLHFHLDYTHFRDRARLLSNNTAHGVLEDQQKNLWISTNQGLVRFDTQARTRQTYNRENGLEVTEFSDGAFYKDPRTGILFFGGTNGFATVKPNAYITHDYMPQISLKGISIYGKEYNIHDFMHEEEGQTVLRLDYSQNFFSINLMAIDYLNGNNHSYLYKLKEISSHWVENGTSSHVMFSNLLPGEYTLLVKYRNNITGKESLLQTFILRITPPWYLSTWAYLFYFFLFILLCICLAYLLRRKYRLKQRRLIEKMDQEKKEEIYESKLRFFTNITHEFCTPLTLIYGPCERILANPRADSDIRKYGKMIQQNTEKLNGLILELLEFHKLETGNKVLSIQHLPVADKLRNIAESFMELAESRNLNYKLDIKPDIHWNTDISCFNKIANNLISNAFKYTPDQGNITVELKAEHQRLVLRISNSGKGIAKENLEKVFDRYKILDSFEMNGKNSRNGLGLAICKSMTIMLNGEITVSSIPNEITTFTVTLPPLSPTTHEVPLRTDEASPALLFQEKPLDLQKTVKDFDTSKHTLMIIDDDPSMLWFISEIFVNEYNVLSFGNVREALASLEVKHPDLIISDIMMPDVDGISFTKKIKQNKLWKHIPLILLSALQHEDEQVKGIEAGAEVYVTKPFNVKYLEKVVYRLIQRQVDLREYYGSIFSSYKVENGNCIHKEDREFLDKVMGTIDKNIENPNLSVEFLSKDLGYSIRQFYRKLKVVTEKSPTDIIKEYRLRMAERLLVTTNHTIEEIMDHTGFINRGTFYRLFSQQFGMPPRQYREQQKDNVKKERTNEDTAEE